MFKIRYKSIGKPFTKKRADNPWSSKFGLVKNNYILLISGYQDLTGIFNSFGYCMTSNEDTDFYSFLMASLKDVASKIKLTFDINFLMNDGSKAAMAAGKQNKTFLIILN